MVFSNIFGLIDWGMGFDSHGEAAFLDLGHGDNLIALLGLGGYSRDDIWVIVWKKYFGENLFPSSLNRTLGSAFAALDAQVGKTEILPPSDMPTMARFRDINDPKSIEAVNPGDLAATYGPDAKFLHATLEITDAPVTSGVIEKKLPWLRNMIGDDPMDHLPIYHVQVPELKQDRIFFVGFVRR